MIRSIAAVLLLAGAVHLCACQSSSWDPNDPVENEPVFSANRRYCAVVREYEGIADFTTERAGNVFNLDDHFEAGDAVERPARTTTTAALYEMVGNDHRLISEIKLDVDSYRTVFVSNSGKYVIGVRPIAGGFCFGNASQPTDPVVTVYNSDGGRVGMLRANDIFTDHDIWQLAYSSSGGIDATLEHTSEDREVIVLSILASFDERKKPRYETRRIDVATAKLLDEKREIFPSPHVYTSAASGSDGFFSRATLGPLPEFPPIMIKARVRGMVGLHVVVSENGDVVGVKVNKALPLGGTEAALDAVKHWKFRRSRAQTSGDVVFHFEDISTAKWTELMRDSPPTEN